MYEKLYFSLSKRYMKTNHLIYSILLDEVVSILGRPCKPEPADTVLISSRMGPPTGNDWTSITTGRSWMQNSYFRFTWYASRIK